MTLSFSSLSPRPDRKGAGFISRKTLGYVLAGSAVAGLAGLGISSLVAQVEGDRGIAPLANSADIQVDGIKVDVTGKNGAEARLQGWKDAEKLAWKKLGGPDMPTESIDAMVSSVVIEKEQVGPRRYIATLGVIFDKAKSSQYVGGGGGIPRSAPMLVVPVLFSGGVQQVFEVRGPWQRAWAEYQASASPVDYVRPSGSGGESLILTAGQPGRRSRLWWRTVLSQFHASDVLMPMARLERQWPGGPIKGTFTARFGPDNTYLGGFSLQASSEQALPEMMEQAVERIDGLYRQALASGQLSPDSTLTGGNVELDRAFAQLRDKLVSGGGVQPAPVEVQPVAPAPTIPAEDVSGVPLETVSVQFVTPDAGAVDAALAAVRGVPGVEGAATVSLAIGGTSVMRVSVRGGSDRLAGALRGQGWQVSGSGATLRISR
ncbi:heavy-metal-associated domain-containing protein [Novosphingobium profundi]|uniref:heavy-metal-associated domain-containing protein n=1 Tax=Novosphingobium profundi TaxID=1774954 RepID=UPI001BDA952B|nr:heavy-metal-associated domain-containing protein [Novosphingobium profundi]MBT0668571.1 heavy-metal-associated domain-containing protein [Novosphingobium profundi]